MSAGDDIVVSKDSMSKESFLKLVKMDCFGRDRWDEMVDKLFNMYAKDEKVSAPVFLRMCQARGDNSSKEDIMSLFCNLLGVKEHELTMDELRIDRATFKDLIVGTLAKYIDVPGAKEKILEGIRPTAKSANYDVVYDSAKRRYVASGSVEGS